MAHEIDRPNSDLFTGHFRTNEKHGLTEATLHLNEGVDVEEATEAAKLAAFGMDVVEICSADGWVVYQHQARFAIPEQNMPEFEDRFAGLVKKAVKLESVVPTYKVVGSYVQDVPAQKNESGEVVKPATIRVWTHVEVEGLAPTLNGWTYLATLDFRDPGVAHYMLCVVPGQSVPSRYHRPETVEPNRCDHCATKRTRRETFLVQNDESGEVVQLGRQCLKDYLGYNMSPTRLASLMGHIEKFRGWASGGGDMHIATESWDQKLFLTFTSTVVRKRGWVSRSKARENQSMATADVVLFMLDKCPPNSYPTTNSYYEWKELHESVCEKDKQKAESMLDWAPALWADSDGDYVFNMQQAIESECVSRKTSGLVASLIACYDRAMNEAAERPESNYVGSIGDKIAERAEVVFVKCIEGFYGVRTLIKFQTDDGNCLVWWASGEKDVERGERYLVSGTVSKHDEYNNQRQTTVKRCGLRQLNEVIAKLTKAQEKVVVDAWPAMQLVSDGLFSYALGSLEDLKALVEKLEEGKRPAQLAAAKIRDDYMLLTGRSF